MNIVYLTTEAVPFAKTGGLADVCGALPARVSELGHRAAIIMPAFRSIHRAGIPIELTDISFAVSMSRDKLIGCRLLKSNLPDGDVPVWFIEQPQYFDRDSLYGTPEGDYPDNAERFAFFCRAALMAITRIGSSVDILHCNDWQTGLAPIMIAADPNPVPWMKKTSTVMTIHNLAHQGNFPSEAFAWTGLDWSHFHADECEYYGQLNFLKTGLITSDMVTTVSPRYSQEIRTTGHGCGLEGVLRAAGNRLVGIINGIDQEIWNPAKDLNLFANYDADSWRDGKHQNKLALQQKFGLEVSGEVPLIGLVGRLASQKGWNLVIPVLRQHLVEGRPTQWVVLGSGDTRYELELRELAKLYPNRFALHVGFSDVLAHQIEAASDVFVMPSLYEPCGLNQLYSLRYGSVPIVTPTGGLADTVVDFDEETLQKGTASGFYVRGIDPQSLDNAIGRALHLRYHDPQRWDALVRNGMTQDWSWNKSVHEYVALYAKAIALKDRSKRRPPV